MSQPALSPHARRWSLPLIALVFLVGIAPSVWAKQLPVEKCQDNVALQGAKYFKAKYKALSKCELARASGKLPLPTNCRPGNGVVTDAKTAEALAKARQKLDSGLFGKCGVLGPDQPIGQPCAQADSLAALGTCLADEGHGLTAEALIETVFRDPNETIVVSDKDARKCQKAISKEVGKHADARLKARRGCGKSFLKGKVTACPDAKAHGKLDKARDKALAKLLGSCTTAHLTDPNGAVEFGLPCDSYVATAFDRVGSTNTNAFSRLDRMARCMLIASAEAGDMGAEIAYPLADPEPFSFGVAAGDATSSAFIAWTRVEGGGSVTLDVATDPEFLSVVDSQVLTPDAAADDTVRTEVTGLSAATQYYYRFSQGGNTSRLGRIRTAPASGGPITFGFTGDSNAFFKPFNVLEQITRADPDLWLYIGDTIYGDDARSGTGVATVRSDYHIKYRENRSDRALRDLMASVGTVTIWDDHEVRNNFSGTDPNIQVQMDTGNQAMRDYMPIREDLDDPLRLYRKFSWGSVVEFFVLDVRQYRSASADVSEPACLEDGEPILTPADPACLAEIADPNRTYLGAEQLEWLQDGLETSTATFKLILNGPLISALGFLPYDRWEGYAAERTAFLDFVASEGIKNVIFLSTDIHAAIVNDEVSPEVREIVAGAIGMDPIFRELPPEIEPIVGTLPALFTSISYFDLDRFTILIGTASSSELTIEYRDASGLLLKSLSIPAVP